MLHDSAFQMGGLHAVWWVLWIALGAVVVYWLLGRSAGGQRAPDAGPDGTPAPREILAQRLASGEIGVQDYEQRKALLDRDERKPQ